MSIDVLAAFVDHLSLIVQAACTDLPYARVINVRDYEETDWDEPPRTQQVLITCLEEYVLSRLRESSAKNVVLVRMDVYLPSLRIERQ